MDAKIKQDIKRGFDDITYSIPGISNIRSAKDTYEYAKQGQWALAGLAGLGAITGIGLFGKLGKTVRLSNAINKSVKKTKLAPKQLSPKAINITEGDINRQLLKDNELLAVSSLGATSKNVAEDIFKEFGSHAVIQDNKLLIGTPGHYVQPTKEMFKELGPLGTKRIIAEIEMNYGQDAASAVILNLYYLDKEFFKDLIFGRNLPHRFMYDNSTLPLSAAEHFGNLLTRPGRLAKQARLDKFKLAPKEKLRYEKSLGDPRYHRKSWTTLEEERLWLEAQQAEKEARRKRTETKLSPTGDRVPLGFRVSKQQLKQHRWAVFYNHKAKAYQYYKKSDVAVMSNDGFTALKLKDGALEITGNLIVDKLTSKQSKQFILVPNEMPLTNQELLDYDMLINEHNSQKSLLPFVELDAAPFKNGGKLGIKLFGI